MTFAALAAAAAAALGVVGFRWPLEAGGILFAPALLTASGLLLTFALWLLFPPRPRPPRTIEQTGRQLAWLGAALAVLAVAQVVQWIA